MKSIRNVLAPLFILGGFVALFSLLHAQDTATQTTAPDSVVQLTAESNGLSLVSPSDLPDAGTFWVVDTNGVLSPNPCPPPNAASLPIYGIADNEFLVDATGGQVSTDGQSVQDALTALADAVNNLISQVQTALAPQTLARAFGMSAAMDSPSDASPLLATFDTSGLYLQITNVSNGLAYLNLMNGTDYVYEIYSKTDFSATNWNIAGEVFPAGTNCMPFTVPALDQTNLFVWARDWTGITSNGNQTPEWWFWKFFGTVDLSDTNLDSSGVNTLLYDYTNNIEPTNAISFTVRLGNQHFNSTSASGSYLVLAGYPSYEAVLVNDTNLNDAAWQPYDGNIAMNLGPTDGVYQVWLGLKGFDTNEPPTWIGTKVTLDRAAPQLVITNPTTSTTVAPYLQLQGYALEPLQSITFDLSNAVAVVTNQPGSIIGHFLNTSTSSYTTDYFQCFDVPLTNGLNSITVYATDLAGNVTVTNLNVNLDYSTATNPAIQLTWPQDGMQICQSSFTLRGWTEDASATVTAQITDANGDTNLVSGLVERTGILWANNLPLAEGTNWVTLWVTNSAGLSSETNISVVKSDMALALTSIDGDLWLPTVNVGGVVSDPTATVWVNGVQGTNNGDGTWNAANVPVSAGGVASFDLKAIPVGGGDPDASTNVTKNTGIEMESASGNYDSTLDFGTLEYTGNWNWSDSSGGSEYSDFTVYGGTASREDTIAANLDITLTHIENVDGSELDIPNNGQEVFAKEIGTLSAKSYLPPAPGVWASSDYTSKVKMVLHTGGTGVIGQQVLVAIHATATEELTTTPYSRDISPGQITIPGLNKTLGSDGWAYGTAVNGQPVDVTPTVGVPMYNFSGPDGGAYVPTITANGIDLSTNTPEFCVGQKVTFAVQWIGGNPSAMNTTALWNLPGKFVNYYEASLNDNASGAYIINPDFLAASTTSCWYVNKPGGTVNVGMNLEFSNGQQVVLTTKGSFTIYRPTISSFQTYPPYYAALVPSNSPNELQLGSDTGTANAGAMAYNLNVNSIAPFTGGANIVQLINASRSVANTTYGGGQSSTTDGQFWHDNSGFYFSSDSSIFSPYYYNVLEFLDQPNYGLNYIFGGYPVNLCSINDSFKDYVVFKPNGSDSIYVTLGRVFWSWSASTSKNNGVWQSPTYQVNGPSSPDESDEFPSWPDTYFNSTIGTGN